MNGTVSAPPGLLVSVRSAAEAEDAVLGGADIVDVKEPSAGSLGAASAEVCCQIAQAVTGRVPWTMACGELADGAARIAEHLAATWEQLVAAADPPAFPLAVKVGLAACAGRPWVAELKELARALPTGVRQVAVIYADSAACGAPTAAEILRATADLRPLAVLVDTFDKQAAGLLGHCHVSQLQAWRDAAAAADAAFVLAGKLQFADFHRLSPVRADIIAVRSAVCSQNRMGRVELERVRRGREALRRFPAGELALDHDFTEKRS
ncbi:MAG: (5-formylfuran-3-yl)methyl phosphate synthase [Pirellulales bacterium]|jgi:uncharacterized protein (UPF0264 family)